MTAFDPESFACPHCGESVRRGAKVCRHCGASDDCGWNDSGSDDATYSTEDDFDYDDFVEREFGTQQKSASEAAADNWGVRLVILAILASWLLVYLL